MSVNPPVSEVAFTIQFQKIAGVTVLDAASLHDLFQGRFPLLQQTVRLPPLQLQGSAMQMLIVPPNNELPRLWLISADSHYLIQFQDDRLSFNWRRVDPLSDDSPYPGYVALKADFIEIYETFSRWNNTRFKEPLVPSIAELYYMNTIPLNDAGEPKRISQILSFYRPTVKKMIGGFNAGWAEEMREPLPGQTAVQAVAGVLPDQSPIVQLNIISKVDVTSVAENPAAWFDSAHAKVLEIFRETIILHQIERKK